MYNASEQIIPANQLLNRLLAFLSNRFVAVKAGAGKRRSKNEAATQLAAGGGRGLGKEAYNERHYGEMRHERERKIKQHTLAWFQNVEC